MALPLMSSPISMSWLLMPPPWKHGTKWCGQPYGYCWGQVVDLDSVMPAAQFHVTEEGGTYLCTVRALVFEGSILTYNPTLNEAEWVPAHGLANDLSWAEERSAVALANYVLHASVEAAHITRLGAGQVVSCPGDNSSTMSMEGEESWHSDAPSINHPWILTMRQGRRARSPSGVRKKWMGR